MMSASLASLVRGPTAVGKRCLWLAVMCSTFTTSMASERPVLRIAYMENTTYVTDAPQELVKRALDDLGYKSEFTALPFSRSVMMANAGEFYA
jgi:hypothetical protein